VIFNYFFCLINIYNIKCNYIFFLYIIIALDETCTNYSNATNECSSEVEINNKEYCFKTNTLYEVIEDSEGSFCKTTKITLGAGIHVFKVDTEVTKLSLTETIVTADVGKLAMYSCTTSDQSVTCSRADGYVKIGADYFTISTNSDVMSEKISGSGYYLLSAGATASTDLISCNSGTCSTVTKSNGYFVNSKNVYKCNTSSCNEETVASVNACTDNADKVINDNSTLKYCANANSIPIELSSATEGYITKSGNSVTILKTSQYAVTTVTSGIYLKLF